MRVSRRGKLISGASALAVLGIGLGACGGSTPHAKPAPTGFHNMATLEKSVEQQEVQGNPSLIGVHAFCVQTGTNVASCNVSDTSGDTPITIAVNIAANGTSWVSH